MQHAEHMKKQWVVIMKDMKNIPHLMGIIAEKGGTRPCWTQNTKKNDRMLLAWPQNSFFRAAIIVSGAPQSKLVPDTVFPFLEGIPNTLRVEDTYPWKNGVEGEVSAAVGDTNEKVWFYDPLYFRDREVDLTEGVDQLFYISGLCYGIRPALLDELTVTQGPQYEAYAAAWLNENLEKTRLDVPALKVNLRGERILMAEPVCSEYQARAVVQDPELMTFGEGDMEINVYRFVVTFGKENFIHIMMYAPESTCINGYVPKTGDEVDLMFWMQGRIADAEDMEQAAPSQ